MPAPTCGTCSPVPKQPGYNKRLRRLDHTIGRLVGMLARDTSLWTDDVWLADSTPVECGGSRETTRRLRRPARKGEAPRAGAKFFKPLRQVIESINDTFKGQLDLEQHGGHTPPGSGSASYNASSP